jgi:hypothetical protein
MKTFYKIIGLANVACMFFLMFIGKPAVEFNQHLMIGILFIVLANTSD